MATRTTTGMGKDWSEGLRPMASRGGSMSSFSLQIDMNCRRKSRSYLEKRNEVVLASPQTLYYIPEFAIFCIHIELKLRAHDAFGIWNGSKTWTVARAEGSPAGILPLRGQDDQVVFWASQVGVMLLQQCQSRDSPIELCTARHRRSNVAVDGVGGGNDRPPLILFDEACEWEGGGCAECAELGAV